MPMADSLGYRQKLGVLIPSTNTSAQPEMDALRPAGVSNHTSRMLIQDDPMTDTPGLNGVLSAIRNATQSALASVLTCNPDRLIVAVSPESYWDGPGSHERVLASIQAAAGGLPVSMSPDAISSALKALGDIRRIAVITPYLPVGDNTVSRFFTESGYDVVGIQGLGARSPAQISHISERKLRDAIRSVDRPDVEAIVQVGTNVALAGFSAVAEAWVEKPVISNNTALYWHALRGAGVTDRVRGWGTLFSHC